MNEISSFGENRISENNNKSEMKSTSVQTDKEIAESENSELLQNPSSSSSCYSPSSSSPSPSYQSSIPPSSVNVSHGNEVKMQAIKQKASDFAVVIGHSFKSAYDFTSNKFISFKDKLQIKENFNSGMVSVKNSLHNLDNRYNIKNNTTKFYNASKKGIIKIKDKTVNTTKSFASAVKGKIENYGNNNNIFIRSNNS